jgi:pyruvate kinase
MLVISNHVTNIGMEIPKDAVVRINLAWISGRDDLVKIVGGTYPSRIWLDYPTGRRKPPRPTLSLAQAVEFAKEFKDRVDYFAFSNAEDVNFIGVLRIAVPELIKLVPKIETKRGVERLSMIVDAAKTDVIMLDKEDLYVDCETDIEKFNQLVEQSRAWCEYLKIQCLELKGVIFA